MSESILGQLGLEQYIGTFVNIGYVGGGLILALIFGFIALLVYKERQTFPYKVRLRSLRSYGNYKERNAKGGMIKSSSGVYFFRIKMGIKPKDYFDIYTTPDFDAVDTEDRLVYERIGHNRFIQLKVKHAPRFILINKETGEQIEDLDVVGDIMNSKSDKELYEQYWVNDLYYQPLPEEKKSLAAARLAIDVNDPLREKESPWKQWVPIIVISLIGVFALAIVYVLLTNPTPCLPVPCTP